MRWRRELGRGADARHVGEVNLVDAAMAEAAAVDIRITLPAFAAKAARLRRRAIINAY